MKTMLRIPCWMFNVLPHRRPIRYAPSSILAVHLLLLSVPGNALAQPVITNQPQTQAAAPGTTATFQVGARGTAPLAYQWQKNPGNGFFALADHTNATLVLDNVQPWDACDYRVVITNITGARTSAVAHLYVMSPALLTNRVVIDSFDDNKLTGWSLFLGNRLTETNQQMTVGGYWPGTITYDPPQTAAAALLYRNWSVDIGQTLEWRVDLVGMNQGATAAILEPVNSPGNGVYPLFKGRDFIKINKYFVGSGPAHFLYERVSLPNSNVVLALAFTRVASDLILTARVLDKANHNAVLYERSVVDTPNVDHTLTEAEQMAASGMRLKAVSDIQAPPWTSGAGLLLDVFQYNFDGRQPAAQATFDNCELWTYKLPIIRYVDANSTNATPPYTNWLTAASNIQDAVDAALPGDEVVVTNGTYASGGRAVGTNVLANRVAVDKPLTVRSVDGPEFTVIQGYQVPGTTNGDGAIRCVYLADGASLSGFTLTNGATRTAGDFAREQTGGGLWCESTNAAASNCLIERNSAFYGGGASGGTLSNCTLTGNSAEWGGGANGSTLRNCSLSSNSATWGGGAMAGTLKNCRLIGNSAQCLGGGVFNAILNNCTLTGNSAEWGGGAAQAPPGSLTLKNCILYFNTALSGANHYASDPLASSATYSCTTPMPASGVGNITNAPLFVDYAGGNLRLQCNSPCINTGLNANAPGPTDLDGLPRIVSGTVDIGAYEFQGLGSVIAYAWLQQYGLPTDGSADAADPDADGHTTWQEWRCQTDPTNALSVLRLLSASPDGTKVTVSWQSVEGVSYFLERSTDLSPVQPFTPLATGIPGQPGTISYTDTNAVSLAPAFYRVGVAQ